MVQVQTWSRERAGGQEACTLSGGGSGPPTHGPANRNSNDTLTPSNLLPLDPGLWWSTVGVV